MKKYIFLILLISVAFAVNAQELGIQFGKSVSTFKFEDTEGVELQNLQKTDNFFMTLEYRHGILLEPLNGNMFLDIGIGYNRYGSSGSDAVLNNYYTWDVTYLGFNLGLDYVVYRNKSITFYVKTTVSPEILIHGTQTINNESYNLVGVEDFDNPILFVRLGAGAQFDISEAASVFVQYMGGQSFGFSGSTEKLNIISHNIGFGVLFNLIKDPYQTQYKGRSRRPK